MGKQRRLLTSVVFIAGGILTAYAIAVHYGFTSAAEKICSPTNSPKYEDCTTHYIILAVLWHIVKAINDISGFVVAAATIALVYFTRTLSKSTDKLWAAGKEQLDHSSETARRQLRAYVEIEKAWVVGKPVPGAKHLVITVVYKNYGQTPARIQVSYRVGLVGQRDEQPNTERHISRNNLAPTAIHTVVVPFTISDVDICNVIDGVKYLVVFMQMKSEDVFGAIYVTNSPLIADKDTFDTGKMVHGWDNWRT